MPIAYRTMSVLTKDEVATYNDLFRKYDKNKDGTLSLQEVVYMCRDFGYSEHKISDSEIIGMFRDIDSNNDRHLSFREFLVIFGKRPRKEITECNLRRLFKKVDKDKSGNIDKEELRKILFKSGLKTTEEEVTMIMKEVDTTGDDNLNFEEFMSVFLKYM